MILVNSLSDLFVISSGIVMFDLNATMTISAKSVLVPIFLHDLSNQTILQMYSSKSISRMPPH